MHLPTQEVISKISIGHAGRARHRFVGGTNLLSATMLRYKQWQINLRQTFSLNDVTLMGVGWWQYQRDPDFYTRTLLRKVLSSEKIHSVRDAYTRKKLESIGLRNVLNTGCPTMWQLTPEHCRDISQEKAQKVILTLTDYHPDPVNDLKLIDLLLSHYQEVIFWPQGSGDMAYMRSLNVSNVSVLGPTLTAYDKALGEMESVDFIGTRLHGGVRAMQFKRRALIVAVDNRAREISTDTGLNVVGRSHMAEIEGWVTAPKPTSINMNWTAIDQWKSQFRGVGLAEGR